RQIAKPLDRVQLLPALDHAELKSRGANHPSLKRSDCDHDNYPAFIRQDRVDLHAGSHVCGRIGWSARALYAFAQLPDHTGSGSDKLSEPIRERDSGQLSVNLGSENPLYVGHRPFFQL